MKRLIAVVLALATLTTLFAIPASAQTPYEGYNYNSWKESVPAPTGYMPDDYFVGRDYECGDFSNPQDIFIGDDDIVYVTDTGNSRIVKFDLEMNYLGVIDSFTQGEEKITFKNPEGMYVSEDGSVFVADTGNGRVLIANPDLTLRSIITKPVNSDVYEQTDELIPIKVFSDMAGIVYVLSRSNNKGILTFDEKGNFLAYYGTSRVKATAEVIAYYFWERFMSDEQRESAVTFTPVEYKSMTYGKDNFVYATLFTSSWDNSGQLKKLNPKGIDVVKQRRRFYTDLAYDKTILGDSEVRIVGGNRTGSNFIDSALNEDCTLIYLLDQSEGKIFVYDNEYNLLYVFGAMGAVTGQQFGTFLAPIAIEEHDTRVYVLDSEDASVTTFKQTTFGQLVTEGISLYNNGEYAAAVEPWTQVLKLNSNYDVAYISLGKAEYEAGNFEQALKYFELAYDRDGYEDAYVELRSIKLKKNFGYIFTGIVLVIAAIAIVPRVVRARKKKKAGGVKA